MSSQTKVCLLPMMDMTEWDENHSATALESLGIVKLDDVTIYEDPDEWNSNQTNPVVCSIESINPRAGVRRMHSAGARFLLATVESKFAAIALRVLNRHPHLRGTWAPFATYARLGMHSFPDLEFEQTIWRGAMSLCVYGDGSPENVEELEVAFSNDPEWWDAASELRKAILAEVQTKLVVYY